MGKKTRPVHVLCTADSLQIKRCRLKVKKWKKIFHESRNFKKARVAILISDKIDFKTMAITRDKKGPSKSTSRYLSKETQNTNLKRHMHSHINCSIIQSSQDMEAHQYMNGSRSGTYEFCP